MEVDEDLEYNYTSRARAWTAYVMPIQLRVDTSLQLQQRSELPADGMESREGASMSAARAATS